MLNAVHRRLSTSLSRIRGVERRWPRVSISTAWTMTTGPRRCQRWPDKHGRRHQVRRPPHRLPSHRPRRPLSPRTYATASRGSSTPDRLHRRAGASSPVLLSHVELTSEPRRFSPSPRSTSRLDVPETYESTTSGAGTAIGALGLRLGLRRIVWRVGAQGRLAGQAPEARDLRRLRDGETRTRTGDTTISGLPHRASRPRGVEACRAGSLRCPR
jgi:hypothetical protein